MHTNSQLKPPLLNLDRPTSCVFLQHAHINQALLSSSDMSGSHVDSAVHTQQQTTPEPAPWLFAHCCREQVPLVMYLMTHAYFCFYHALSNLVLRRVRA